MKIAYKTGLIVALCLALWPALASAEPPKPKGNLVYADDFSEPKKTGLEDNPEAKDYGRGFHAPGVYILNLHKASDTHWTLIPKHAYGEFTMEIDLWDDSDSFQGSASQGIVFRAKDDMHLYAVLIDPRGGKYTARKLDGMDKWSDLIAWKPSSLIKRKSEINHLRVDGDSGAFTIYLNGESLDSFSDSTYPQGGFGMIASTGDATETLMHFDNVNIYTTEAKPAEAMQPAGQMEPAGQMQPHAGMQPSNLPTTGQSESTAPLALAVFAFGLLLLGLWVRRRL
jgi:LPXTG-motif cell wall-anchored protein